jgi:hypothetical protein
MFGTTQDETKNQNASKTESTFDPKSIPVHTMQDDLNMLEGKAVTSVPSFAQPARVESNQIQKKENVKAPTSPFEAGNSPFSKAPASSIPVAPINVNIQAKPLIQPVSKPKEASPIPVIQKIGTPVSAPHNWTMISGIFLLGVAFLGVLGGGYYFYMTRYNVPEVEIQVPEKVAVPVEVAPEPVIVEKFSAEKPNYLMIDVEKVDMAAIQNLILQKASETRQDGKTVPIEFVVVDQNNNPIALKIFALLMKVNLSQKILDNLGDDFSLFVFNDGDNVRLGMSLSPKNSIKLATDLKLEEKILIKTLEPLLLGEKIKSSVGVFKDSVQGDITIRYANLNDQNSLSVDYWIQDGKWFVATSKGTGRAIIAKMSNLEQE